MSFGTVACTLGVIVLLTLVMMVRAHFTNERSRALNAICVVVLIACAYLGYTFWTLVRLSLALRQRDVETLSLMIDWPSVRESIRTDASGYVFRVAPNNADARNSAVLVGPAVDSLVTPNGLRNFLYGAKDYSAPKIGAVTFATATILRCRMVKANWEPFFDFEMRFEGGAWRVFSVVALSPEFDAKRD